MSRTLSIRLTPDLADWLEKAAARSGISQGRLVREQLEKARAAGEQRKFMRLAGIIRGGPRDLSMRKGFSKH
ncbi:MAG: ribbon-helix-helix protein, CopG family [Planctomycetota bacterium]